MKKIIIICLSLFISSCATTIYQLNTECPNASTDELLRSITTLLLQEGFIIKQNDPILGFLQAETIPKYNIWTGMNETRYWIFQENNKKIIAYAKSILTKQNIFGATTGGGEVYFSDNSHEDWTWYWTIRIGLEKICGSKIVITEKNQY